MKLHIHGYSTALFSTWFFIEELGILFDAGDGVTSHLLQKSRKINHVFITHPDRDHLTGLIQLNQLNAREGFPKIYYPKDSGSFDALKKFTIAFDPHVKNTEWKPINTKETIKINDYFEVESKRNNHINAPQDIIKSLSYDIFEVKLKLKNDFQSLSQDELKKVISEKGKDFVGEKIKTKILSYAGDTPVDDYSKYDGAKILIHESTFINEENKIKMHGNKHSQLHEVMKMVSEIKIENLILHHFSSRYSKELILEKIESEKKKFGIKIPIHIVLPGEVSLNIC